MWQCGAGWCRLVPFSKIPSVKGALKCLFFVKIKSFRNIFDLNRKILFCLKRKQERFCFKNSWIRRFGISENMSRRC